MHAAYSAADFQSKPAYARGACVPPPRKNLAGVLGIPECMPPIRRRIFRVRSKYMKKRKSKYTFSIFKRERPLHLMLLPGVLMILVFNYTTMAGLIIAFQRFTPSKGLFGDQEWIGF